MKRAQRQAATSSTAISKSLGVIKSGLAGFASALTVGLLTNVIKGALDYAGSLGEVSQQLGVTTKELQTFRYAVQQNGGTAEDADKSLGKLTLSIGKALAGSKQAAAAFGAVGVSLSDLSSKSKGEVLGQIADGMKKTGGASANAAAGVAIFGKGFQKIVPVLDQGSAGINALSAAAEELGIVLSDEQIQRADDTADKLDALKTVLSAQIAGVVADNAAAILQFANALVSVVAEIATAINAYRQLRAEFNAGFYTGIGNEDEAAKWRGSNYQSGKQPTVPGKSVTVSLGPAKPVKMAGAAPIQKYLAGGGGGARKARGSGGADAAAAKAERARIDAIRDAYRFDEDMRRADMDILRAKESLSTDYTERSALAIQMLDLERASFAAEQANQVALGEITQAQAAQKQAKFDLVDGLERQKVLQDEETQRQETYNALEATSFQQQRELLEQQSGLAETAAERRVVELRILELALQEARDRQARLERESTDWQAIETGRRELAGMEARQAGAREGVNRSTRGPLEGYLAGIPDTAAKMEEALQGVKVNAIDGIVQGLSDAATGAAKLGDVFKNVAKQIIADLIRIQLQKAIVGALSKALGGFGGLFSGGGVASGNLGASGSDMLGGGSGLFVPGFATGGGFNILGKRGRDKNIMSLNGLPIARVSHGERVNISNDNVNAAGGSPSRISIVPSPYFNVVVDQRAGAVAAPMAGRAAMVGAAGGQQAISRKQRRSIP